MNPNKLIRKIFPTARRLLVEKSLRRLAEHNYRKVLVVGAGFDPYEKYFREVDQYVLLDIKYYKNCTNVIADVQKLPFAEEVFDCILVVEVFEHVANPFLMIQEMGDVLKTGGAIILTVPFIYHVHGDPQDFWRPTKQTLRRLFSGYSTTDIYSQGNRLHSISDLISTSFAPYPVFFPFRILNHLFVMTPRSIDENGKSSAPSGYFVKAVK